MRYTYNKTLSYVIGTSLIIILLLAIGGCNNQPDGDTLPAEDMPSVPIIPYTTKAIYPHDTTLFTEGLVFHNGLLYESGGAPPELPFTKSVIGVSDWANGNFAPRVEIDRSKYFGEGIVFLKNKLYQLTYKNQKGFIYDATTFKKIGEFTYANTEGWGLTTDGKYLIMSDGTNKIHYLNPGDLLPVKVLNVSENGTERDQLNELELINGFIYANVWQTPFIVKIDTATGRVVGKLNLSAIRNEVFNRKPTIDALNGIAYDSATGKVLVTGKLWPSVYEIDFQK
jgi:glutamine cyclotransferase